MQVESVKAYEDAYNIKSLVSQKNANVHANLLEKQNTFNSAKKGNNNIGVMAAHYYQSESLSLSFSNQDGDTVTLSMEHVQMQEAMVALEGHSDSSEWKKVVEDIKNQFLSFKEEVIKSFIESLEGEPSKGVNKTEAPEIPGLPEYWNAENTSQRIVDFATSFYGVAEAMGEDYYELMRGAIEEGFSQALGILGEMPDAVNNLVQETYDLTMEKLDAWASSQGIVVEGQEASVSI